MVAARHKATPHCAAAKAALLKHCSIPADPDYCWSWTGAKKTTGYGRLRFRSREYIASRLSFAVHNNLDPKGLDVCHSCDNPQCCNPRHLFLGTHQDNMEDAVTKGRRFGPLKGSLSINVGELNGMAKLTNQDRAEIRRLYEAGKKQSDIAARFGVGRNHISVVVKGCTSRRPLSANRERVEAMVRDGVSDTEIAATFGVTISAVGKFRKTAMNLEA